MQQARAIDEIHRILNHGQRLEAQEIEFDQASLLHPFHIKLRRGHVRARILIERHQLIQWPVANHHARRMG